MSSSIDDDVVGRAAGHAATGSRSGDVSVGRVVLAPDKFKGSLTAAEVAAAVSTGLHTVLPDLQTVVAPVADGGEGTVEAALAAGFSRVPTRVQGPLGEDVDAVLAVRGDTAVVELAQASGLMLVPPEERRPLRASSFGTGQLIRVAMDAGCRTVILAIGGSANTDGGAGMLQALGARLTDSSGTPIALGGGALQNLSALDLQQLDPRIAGNTFVIASDVDHPLLGPRGAAAVFAPQKGASPAQVVELESGLTRWAEVVADAVGRDHASDAGAGAAGGVGFAALALLGAQPRSGIEVMLELTGFDTLLEGAGLVVTGEGSLDDQSLGGKTPVGVAAAAAARGVRTVAVAGVTRLSEAALSEAGFAATYTLADLEPDLVRCMTDAAALLERIGTQIARDWLAPKPTVGGAR